MRQAQFHNFTDSSFTGYWNGKPHTFKPGEKKFMPEYLAEHFAKHLTNRELTSIGKELYCSPKKPKEVPQFYEMFKKACIIEEDSEESDQASIEIAMANHGPSMNVNVKRGGSVDPYDSKAQPVTGPAGEPTVLTVPGDDEFEDN